MFRRTILASLAALLLFAMVPHSASAQNSAPAGIDIRVMPHAHTLGPGNTTTVQLEVRVTFAYASYCLEPMRLRLKVAEVPAYAIATVDPESSTFALGQPYAPIPTHATSYHVRARMTITTSPEAPAYEPGEYTVVALLETPPAPMCNIAGSVGRAHFVLINEYRPGIEIIQQGWLPDLIQTYQLELINHANGPTRVWMEPVSFDQFASGRITAESVVLKQDGRAAMHILAQATDGEDHDVPLMIRSTFEGQHPEAPVDSQTIMIRIRGDGSNLAAQSDLPRAVPGLDILPVGLVVAALAALHGRRRGR